MQMGLQQTCSQYQGVIYAHMKLEASHDYIRSHSAVEIAWAVQSPAYRQCYILLQLISFWSYETPNFKEYKLFCDSIDTRRCEDIARVPHLPRSCHKGTTSKSNGTWKLGTGNISAQLYCFSSRQAWYTGRRYKTLTLLFASIYCYFRKGCRSGQQAGALPYYAAAAYRFFILIILVQHTDVLCISTWRSTTALEHCAFG